MLHIIASVCISEACGCDRVYNVSKCCSNIVVDAILLVAFGYFFVFVRYWLGALYGHAGVRLFVC